MTHNGSLKRQYSDESDIIKNNKIQPQIILCFMCERYISSMANIDHKISQQTSNMEMTSEKMEQTEKTLSYQIICYNCRKYANTFTWLKRK